MIDGDGSLVPFLSAMLHLGAIKVTTTLATAEIRTDAPGDRETAIHVTTCYEH